jgi:hypothetical protein
MGAWPTRPKCSDSRAKASPETPPPRPRQRDRILGEKSVRRGELIDASRDISQNDRGFNGLRHVVHWTSTSRAGSLASNSCPIDTRGDTVTRGPIKTVSPKNDPCAPCPPCSVCVDSVCRLTVEYYIGSMRLCAAFLQRRPWCSMPSRAVRGTGSTSWTRRDCRAARSIPF